MFPPELWEQVLLELRQQQLQRRTQHWLPLHQELLGYQTRSADMPDNFFFMRNLHCMWWYRLGKYGQDGWTGIHCTGFSGVMRFAVELHGVGHLYALREDGVLATFSWDGEHFQNLTFYYQFRNYNGKEAATPGRWD
jgi:hypothetical protein